MGIGPFIKTNIKMKKYNIGIIGYSWAAEAHIDAINNTP